MWQESTEQAKPLRTGLTTGTCATACSVASALALFELTAPTVVSVTLPKGKIVELTVDTKQISKNSAISSTIKDAGDDPDVTHGAKVFVEISLKKLPSITFEAGHGVGEVTKAGLLLAVGEPAINPVPRKMITENLQMVADAHQYKGGFHVVVGIERGELLALKTMNPRLGILGGLSILGTTGIVRPFSCAAWIASIYQGLDVAYANGFQHVAATTGHASETAVKSKYELSDMALIEMGDFVGAVLKHLKISPIKRISICGGFGKMTKLANGHMDLHSRVSSIDFQHLATVAANLGADSQLQTDITQANTSIEALSLCKEKNIDLAAAICQQALSVSLSKIPSSIEIEILAIDRQGKFIAQSSNYQT